MMNRKSQVWILMIVLLFLLVACGGTVGSENKPAQEEDIIEEDVPPIPVTEAVIEETPAETDVTALLSTDQLGLADLFANADEETSGPILTMRLVNQSDGELVVEIPCGLIFLPDDGSDQPLMVVEPQTVAIPIGGEAEITPYVVCADIGAAAPALAATYTVGTLTEDGQMQQLADCICDKGFDTSLYAMDGVNVQFAVWFVQMDGDPAGFLETMMAEMSEEEFEDLVSSDDDVEAFIEMLEIYGVEWLTECGIEFDE